MREHLWNGLVTLAAAGLMLLAGCQDKPEVPEPIPAAGPIPLNHFVRSWARETSLAEGDAVKAIHPRDNQVFVYTKSGQMHVLSRETGQLLWMAQIRATDRGGMRPPVILKDKIALPTSSTLEMFEPTEGGFLASIPLGVATRSNAVGAGDLVFLGGDSQGSGRFLAIDTRRAHAHTLWQLLIVRGGLASTPALFEDTVYIGGGDGNVYAVAAQNREAVWSLPDGAFKTEGPIVGDVTVDETGVYVGSTDSRVYCLNRGTGRLKWQYYSGRPLLEGPIVTESQVFLMVPGVGVAALEKNDGPPNRKAQWIAEGLVQYLSEDETFVYFRRGADNVIVAVDKKTGEERFENNRRDLVVFATNMKRDGVIFAASKTNRVVAIKPVLRPGVVGELVWDERELTEDETAVALAR